MIFFLLSKNMNEMVKKKCVSTCLPRFELHKGLQSSNRCGNKRNSAVKKMIWEVLINYKYT